DDLVTGVQTCALPICPVTGDGGFHAHDRASRSIGRRAFQRGVRSAGAVPTAPRWLLDRLRVGLWLGERQVRQLYRQLQRGRCDRSEERRVGKGWGWVW